MYLVFDFSLCWYLYTQLLVQVNLSYQLNLSEISVSMSTIIVSFRTFLVVGIKVINKWLLLQQEIEGKKTTITTIREDTIYIILGMGTYSGQVTVKNHPLTPEKQ